MYTRRRQKMNIHLNIDKKKTIEGKLDKFMDNATRFFLEVYE